MRGLKACAPVADEVCVDDDGILLEKGNGGGAPKGEVAHLISLAGGAAHLHREVDGAHLTPGHRMMQVRALYPVTSMQLSSTYITLQISGAQLCRDFRHVWH